ncbi:hypothetical protein D3C77_700090 [compost metagenome]
MSHGEAEAYGLVLAEVGHLDVLQMALVDKVVGRDGIAQKHIGLVEGDRIECILIGRV